MKGKIRKKRNGAGAQRGSYLATMTGIIILAVLLFIAAYFKMNGLIMLLICLLIVSVTAFLWTSLSLSRLELETGSGEVCGFPGEELSAGAALTNNKILPVLWLKLRMPDESEKILAAKSGDGTVRSLLWIMPYQTISWNLKLDAKKRGCCLIDCLRVAGGDGLGLSEREENIFLKRPAAFIVYPELVPTDCTPLLRRLQEPETVPFGTYEDTTLIKYARGYQHGDSARRINWRQVARTGSLEVNIYEKQEMRHIALALDMEAFVYMEEVSDGRETHLELSLDEEAFEDTVSLLASAAMELLEHDVCCTLIAPDGRVSAGSPGQGADILRSLAMLDPLRDAGKLPDEGDLAFRHRDGPVFLFTNECDARIKEWLERWKSLGACVICRKGASDDGVMAADEVRA